MRITELEMTDSADSIAVPAGTEHAREVDRLLGEQDKRGRRPLASDDREQGYGSSAALRGRRSGTLSRSQSPRKNGRAFQRVSSSLSSRSATVSGDLETAGAAPGPESSWPRL